MIQTGRGSRSGLCYTNFMTRILRYVTHPQVHIDPSVPIPDWSLSEVGRRRAAIFANLPLLSETSAIASSAENKARETAEIISSVVNAPIQIYEKSHENDRSATGFLEQQEVEKVADRFFASPWESIRGWEKAIDAQRRIVSDTARLVRKNLEGDLLMVGHGAVGTLLFCHLAELDINRKHDQPGGGGHIFLYNLDTQTVCHP